MIFFSSVIGLPLIVVVGGHDGLVEAPMKLNGLLVAVRGPGGARRRRLLVEQSERSRRQSAAQGRAAEVLTIPDDQFKRFASRKPAAIRPLCRNRTRKVADH